MQADLKKLFSEKNVNAPGQKKVRFSWLVENCMLWRWLTLFALLVLKHADGWMWKIALCLGIQQYLQLSLSHTLSVKQRKSRDEHLKYY